MSSLHISILCILLTIIIADNRTLYFTKSNYDLWCQENILTNSLFLYPDEIPIGIYRTSNIKQVTYHLIDDNNNGLFQIKSKRLADFYFLIINITRPFDINREYQDIYTLKIQAKINEINRNVTDEAEIHLHIADSNDNDGVFDMDIYEENYTQSIDLGQTLIRFHASDADEIQHAQILYELTSSFNETFSLHPFTGYLYLTRNDNLQSTYEFDVYAYDRYRKRLVDNNMKTKTHVKLNFNQTILLKNKINRFQTIFNKTIEYKHLINQYNINIIENKMLNLINIHQPILTIDLQSNETLSEIYLLNNSSLNTRNLFIHQKNIYLNQYRIEEYNLQLFLCFKNHDLCQYKSYHLIPFIDFNFYKFHFKSIEKIILNDNLPIDSYITRFQIDHIEFDYQSLLNINYKLLNDEEDFQFYINSKTGILRLAERLEYRSYIVDIQANINLFNRRYSIETSIEINVQEINKYRPTFHNNTPSILFQLPYQFQAFDFDQMKDTNGRVTYRLWNCFQYCPFEIDPNSGLLNVKQNQYIDKYKTYDLQIIAFDWGQPISLESRISVRIDLELKLIKRDLTRTRSYSRRWKKKSTEHYLTTISNMLATEKSSYTTQLPLYNNDRIYLNVGFQDHIKRYYLSEHTDINTIIDHISIEFDSFPFDVNVEKEDLFFYMINDTSVPFAIDQDEKVLKVIDKIDREKQDKYVFEIELKFKSIYSLKLNDLYNLNTKNSTFFFQYTNKYYQKLLVFIYINDINDNIPQCQTYHINIQLNENQIEKNIYQLKGYDLDSGENGTISYSLLNYQQYFSINSQTGQIDCIKAIDYEQISSIVLHTIVSDHGFQPQYQSICTTLHIQINDINDNKPEFSSNNYTFYLFSDMSRYSIFGQVYASDIDSNDKLTYSIDPNPYLTINMFTGHLRLKYNLHRLIDQTLNVTCHVSDGLHQNHATIIIYIMSYPDAQQPIVLSEPGYSLTINESLSKGSIITNVYRRFQIISSTVDFIEIVHNQIKLPFSIDQQGYLRLTDSLIGSSKLSYWILLRLTRYRAHPPHTHVHIHISIRQENFYLPKCIDLYQNIKLYDYAIQYPFARVQAATFNKNSNIQYSLNNQSDQLFSIDKQTGLLSLVPLIQTNRRIKSDQLLTVNVVDNQYKLSVNCYLKIHLIRRRQLVPKFLHSTTYTVDLPEIKRYSGRLRQRLFQITSLLGHEYYDKTIEIRYRIVNSNQYFIINRQTGYIAAKQPLNAYNTYELEIEAFTVANRDDLSLDGNEHDNDDHMNRGKWRVISARATLPIKIRILPMMSLNKSLISTIDSTINLDLLVTTEVGTKVFQLGRNSRQNSTQWFIMIGDVYHTRYFHVDFQTGYLTLIRPLGELINQTNTMELRINTTNDWINMNTIKVFIRFINNQISTIKFSQNDYYSSISKNIPIGAEIARLTIDNSQDDCTYSIDRVDRIKSKDLFQINSQSGSITVRNSLEYSQSQTHILTIVYYCQHNYHMASTNLHINILDDKSSLNQTDDSYRFAQENYLIIFESSLGKNRKKYLLTFELINRNNNEKRIQPNANILQGDPLGLFAIDPVNQSLYLTDESLARSYIYPINLLIIDLSQNQFINTTVKLFISNIGLYFPCSLNHPHSPYILTYESDPSTSVDRLTGQIYNRKYESLTINGFDPLTPLNGEASNYAECIQNNNYDIKATVLSNTIDFRFENDIYSSQIENIFNETTIYLYNLQFEPISFKIKQTFYDIYKFNITYHFVNQTYSNQFRLDLYSGLIEMNYGKKYDQKYSLLIYAKYQTFITLTRLNINFHRNSMNNRNSFIESIYEFKLDSPYVNNYTIGYLNRTNENFIILNKNILPMISIENRSSRIYVRNRTLLLTNNENFYDFLIQNQYMDIFRIKIFLQITTENDQYQCQLNRLTYSYNKSFIGYIDVKNMNSNVNSYELLNYKHLFLLHRQHAYLYYRSNYEQIDDDLLLLIKINNSKCLINIERTIFQRFYISFRNQSDFYMNMIKQYRFDKPSGQMNLLNGTLINYNIVSSKSPIFLKQSYEFELNLMNITNHTTYIGQILAEGYDKNHSHLVYELINRNRNYFIDPDNGVLTYVTNEYRNKTEEQLEIRVRDLIFNENNTINVTIKIKNQKQNKTFSSIYYKTISEVYPINSIIFELNNSNITDIYEYYLEDYDQNLFSIDSCTGQVRLRSVFKYNFYSFKIRIQPIDEIILIKLFIIDYNNHVPIIQNLPSNISFTLNDKFLTKLSANDLDLNDNLHLEYFLLNKHDEMFFHINSSNGLLTLNTNNLTSNYYQIQIGVTDGLHLTETFVQLNMENYAKHSPKFSLHEYLFEYDEKNSIIGQLVAYDYDLNDEIFYDIYLQPSYISIDHTTGLIKINETFLSKSTIEFYGSARDLSSQIVYTKIKIIQKVQVKFRSNLFFINLKSSDVHLPMDIFQFELVDSFNKPLLESIKYELKNRTNLFEINNNKLILKDHLLLSNEYRLLVNGYWNNMIATASIQIKYIDHLLNIEKKFYEFQIDKIKLTRNYFIEKFQYENYYLNILSTPLTRNNCETNFYIQNYDLHFNDYPIQSDYCVFQIEIHNNRTSYLIDIDITFYYSLIKPIFSSNIYSFNVHNSYDNFYVFAISSNPIYYSLEMNSYGLIINQTNGQISFRYGLHFIHHIQQIQLNVYAIDEKTNLNESAIVILSFNDKRSFQIPTDHSNVTFCPNLPIQLSDQSLPGTVIQDISINNNGKHVNYYILSGDMYGLFSINNNGQLYLTSSNLNETTNDYFHLIILISTRSSLSYCQTNITINRTPKWSYFICPSMPIQWMIEEETPIGTIIGTVKETLIVINNSSTLIDKLNYKLSSNDEKPFLINSQTGVITSNSHLDYEQKIFYSFSIQLLPIDLNCSMTIRIKLININDNPIKFNINSLIYNINENNYVPYYVGRMELIDLDKLLSYEYEYYLDNQTTMISIDRTTGSILLNEKLDREYHGSKIIFNVNALDRENTTNLLKNQLILNIVDINDNGPKFPEKFYYLNISKTIRPETIVFQLHAISDDPIDNGNMTYSLLNSFDYFSIDPINGIIRLKKSLPSTMTNLTIEIEVKEDNINLTDHTSLYLTIINDDSAYFNLHMKNNCTFQENQPIGTEICTIGKLSNDFLYEFITYNEYLQINSNNGTIISRKIFDYETDEHQLNVTVIVRERENQSSILSSLNLTINLINLNDNYPEFISNNLTTIVYLYYPLIDTNLHAIDFIDKDQSNLTFEILNDTLSLYKISSTLNQTNIVLKQSINHDHEDNIIIRMSDNEISYTADLHIRIIFVQRDVIQPVIIPQTIDGYINLEETNTKINFGQLFVKNSHEYKFIYYNLTKSNNFYLKQIMNNESELHFQILNHHSSQNKHRLLQFKIELTVFATEQSMPNIDYSNNTIIYLPKTNNVSLKSHSIDIHLWSIDREMLDRTLSIIINLHSKSTYEQFIIHSLPLIREKLAEIIGVNIRHVHLYTFDLVKANQIELLAAIIRHPSRLRPARYIHKKLLYNVLKNVTNIFEKIPNIRSIEKIIINKCHSKSCKNNGRCTSHIKLLNNQYDIFYYNTYQRLIPKFQWNIKCLCLNHYYGQYCQFKQDYQSPCSSNPCSAMERCIEESANLYTCQCIDEPCNYTEILLENTLDCMNINSPTCRDSSNTLTFDGYSFIRMNLTMNLTEHNSIVFTFRTQVGQGKLIQLISIDNQTNQYSFIVQIHNGYINFEINKNIHLELNDIKINDGLWHNIYFSIDFLSKLNTYYYILRLDDVFSKKIDLQHDFNFNDFNELYVGTDFHGCLGNLTLNNKTIFIQKQHDNNNNKFSIEHIGTNDGCQLAEIETRTLRQYAATDDLCSSYHPCYHGGICSSQNTKNGLSFTCNCLKPRFAGRQCQQDLQPCDSNPCPFDQQCLPLSISIHDYNISYKCTSSLINLPMSTKNILYIGLIFIISIFVLFVLLLLSLIIYCQQRSNDKKRKANINNDKLLVSAPLLIQKASPPTNTVESPMQTLLKLNQQGKQTTETLPLTDNNSIQLAMNNFNDKDNAKQLNQSSQSIDKQQTQSSELLNNLENEPKYYSTIGRMNIPPDNFLVHYNTIDNENVRLSLNDAQTTNLFEFPASPTKYFNNNHDNNSNNYQIHINSLSNLTEKLVEQNEMELTHSSNESSHNESTLLTSPIINSERKRSLFNGGSTQSIRASNSSLQKAPVYAKVIKGSVKNTNNGLSTIERLRLSGSPLRLLSSSPTYLRTTSFLKSNISHDKDNLRLQESPTKSSKIHATSWKLNPRKLDSLKARRNSRQTDDDDDEGNYLNETSQLTMTTATAIIATNRLKHASDSDLSKHVSGKKSTKLSSFFQTEV